MISDEEDEVEKFEITDFDLENEFSQHKRKRLSKNQQIYGIWAQESDEEEEAAPKASFASRKSYTSRIGFVSGGVQQSGKPKASTSSLVEDEEEVVVVSKKSKKPSQYAGLGSNELAGMRSSSSSSVSNSNIANWEKYTKGIGSKLLLQMGYQPGKGLGSSLQGIATPVEVHKRQGRGAIGAYGVEKGQRLADTKETYGKTKQNNEAGSGSGAWRKSENTAKKKIKYVYRSVEEVLESSQGKRFEPVELSDASQVKVIDMRGPEQRIFSGYSHLRHEQFVPQDVTLAEKLKHRNFDLPELMHNLDLLTDLAEEDLVKLDKKSMYSSDRIVALEQEETVLTKRLREEDEAISVLNELLDVTNQLEARCTNVSEASDLRQILTEGFAMLGLARSKHPIEFKFFKLHHLAVPILFPLVKRYLHSWHPLECANFGTDVFGDAKVLLEDVGGEASDNVYYKLVWDCWMPRLRAAVSIWEPRECEKLATIFDVWKELVPQPCWLHILEAVVLPKLQAAVDEWNPLTDTVPIHGWIHPWLQYMGTHLEILYPVIRQKLGDALMNWHAADRSARLMLTPWVGVWSRGSMEAFLLRHIVPKLHAVMLQVSLAPGQEPNAQQMSWVSEWSEMIPLPMFSAIYMQSFFPRWLQALSLWLNHAPRQQEVSAWYVKCKTLFPAVLLSVPAIKDYLRQALEMMQRSALGVNNPGLNNPGLMPVGPQAPPPPPPPPFAATAQEMQRQLDLSVLAEAMNARGSAQEGFKDVLARRCHERGIVFYPIPNRTHEAKQVYLCGKLNLCLDKNVIFMLNERGVWVPVALQDCIELASQQ
ncbi:unnamed protein product [Notodromas monacha]|uniref:G-patch domain-containing protein n=1 Tax=Notodromas monacha TaxID=399045 RepID=A0A7R9GD21_9CRUS|nr:unnamed protein product [Notodromas monacha]CAG0916458.1 unnamed protein product [Notodromas monacha]